MVEDSIVAEVRQARDALAKRFNYDLRAMIEDARRRQAASGRKVVSFQPRPARISPRLVQMPGQRTKRTELPERR
jgi:hypothetical protein